MMRTVPRWLTSFLFAAVVSAHAATVEFRRDIYPMLAEHCVKCHGPEKQKGGLRLDLKVAALGEGDSGERAIVPGHASQSRLFRLVSSTKDDERMPPKGVPLFPGQIDLLKRWIDAGAEWPESPEATTANVSNAELKITDEDRRHWSFLPLNRVTPPQPKDTGWVHTEVDMFIRHAQEAKRLKPAPEAAARVLVRRIYFDVLGLPPTPLEVEEFVDSTDPQAYEKLVDRLLASPHYGERWARHWLDVARYADSHGQEADDDRPTAYHYRDFVIRALNEDMPYDQFVRWQIAGDEFDPDNPLAISATGFLTAGVSTRRRQELMEEERLRNRYNELDDMIATTGSAMLGLTLGCARCHDHKYDPIPTRDYYRLMTAFHSGDRAEVPLATRAEVAKHAQSTSAWKQSYDAATAKLNDWLAAAKLPHSALLRESKIADLKASDEDKARLRDGAQKGSSAYKALQKQHAKALQISDEDYYARFDDAQRAHWNALAAEVKRLEQGQPQPLPTAFAMEDFDATPVPTWLFRRGEFLDRGDRVELGFVSVLTKGRTPAEYYAMARAERPLENSTYQRKALALWMTDLDHGPGALLARVMVNRIWQHHFGEGLVRTVNDFGTRGDAPSHPELLEWLAHEFVAGGWKLKRLHRAILTSATYRQSATHDAAMARLDPENRLHWHWPLQRLESEVLRDAMLAVSGTLNPRMMGPAFKPPIAVEAMQARNTQSPYPKNAKDEPATRRRTVYMFHKRVIQYPLMQAFDGPDATQSCGQRSRTTVATQGLAMLNDGFVRLRAEEFADRLPANGSDTAALVRQSYELAFGRAPTVNEIQAGVEFINSQTRSRHARAGVLTDKSRRLALADYCQVLFGLNEFIYIE